MLPSLLLGEVNFEMNQLMVLTNLMIAMDKKYQGVW
jgi:hypothetical protein